MGKSRLGNAMILGFLLLAAPRLQAQTNPDWSTPIAPFHIAGNLYYVGGKDLASYLLVTPQGDILINSSLESSVPLIRASVEQLGFKFKDIKILLISHAHFDHDAGSSELIRETGAKYMVMDGDAVKLGGTALTAHKTAGHTRGCTTWTMRVTEAGRPAQCCHRRQLECESRLAFG
jgi:metallo-beta-lactamase class B